MGNHDLSAALRTVAALLDRYPDGPEVCSVQATRTRLRGLGVEVQLDCANDKLSQIARWAQLLDTSVQLCPRPDYVSAEVTVEVATHDDPWSVTRVKFWDHLRGAEVLRLLTLVGVVLGEGETRTVAPGRLLAVASCESVSAWEAM